MFSKPVKSPVHNRNNISESPPSAAPTDVHNDRFNYFTVTVVMRKSYTALRCIGVCLLLEISLGPTSGLVAGSHDSEEYASGEPS